MFLDFLFERIFSLQREIDLDMGSKELWVKAWRGSGRVDGEKQGQLALRVHPPEPLLCPCHPGGQRQTGLSRGVAADVCLGAVVTADEKSGEGIRRDDSGQEQGGMWARKYKHPRGFLGKLHV